MTLVELEQSLNRYGSELDNWPIELRETALRFIANNANAQRLLDQYNDEESTFDRLLDQLVVKQAIPEFPGLEARVIQQQLPQQSRSLLDQLLNWLLPKPDTSGLKLWRPAMAACLPLLFGMLLSNVFSFGINTNLDSVENWDDEFYLLSLNDYVETIL